MLADDLVAGLVLGVLVDDGDGGAELDLAARKPGDVDDLGTRHPVLDVGNLPLDPALAFLGRVILGVLREIAVRTCLGDGGNHSRPLQRLETLQIIVESLIALGGHWDFFHNRVVSDLRWV